MPWAWRWCVPADLPEEAERLPLAEVLARRTLGLEVPVHVALLGVLEHHRQPCAVRHGAPSAVAGTARGSVAAPPEGAKQADDVGVRRQPLVQLELVAHRVAALASELRARALLDHDLGPARFVLCPVDRAAAERWSS